MEHKLLTMEELESIPALKHSMGRAFIAFSSKLKVSQYFRSGTSILDAIIVLNARGYNIDVEDLKFLDPSTGTLMGSVKLKPVTSYTVIFE